MTEKDADQSDERATEVREHLANERTLLSWGVPSYLLQH